MTPRPRAPASALVPSPPQAAADQTFLYLEGIKGDAQDAVHKDEIVVSDWSWGGQRDTKVVAGKDTVYQVLPGEARDINITHQIDAATPLLWQKLFTPGAVAATIPTLKLTARNYGGAPQRVGEGFEYLKILCKVGAEGRSPPPAGTASFVHMASLPRPRPPHCRPLQNVFVVGIESASGQFQSTPTESVLFRCRLFAIAQYTQGVVRPRCFCWDPERSRACDCSTIGL